MMAVPSIERFRVMAGIDHLEEAEMLAETAYKSDTGDAPVIGSLSHVRHSQPPKTSLDCVEDRPVLVGYSEDPSKMRSFGVKDPGEKALAPGVARLDRPFDEVRDGIHPSHRLISYGKDRLVVPDRFLEDELGSRNPARGQKVLGSDEPLDIDQRQAKPMYVVRWVRPGRRYS